MYVYVCVKIVVQVLILEKLKMTCTKSTKRDIYGSKNSNAVIDT